MDDRLNKIKPYLDKKVKEYNNLEFIEHDPIQIPHRFSKKEDIEISAFLIANMAWGNRKIIINKGSELMERMDSAPHDFIIYHQTKDLNNFNTFKHRTMNVLDIKFFLQSLQNIYLNYNDLESLFQIKKEEKNAFYALERFRKVFFELAHEFRTEKHISSPAKGSAAKRLNMFLRWMVRKDKNGVDFGLWNSISMSKLSCPLDVHSGNVAREIGLLLRKQNDWKAVSELDESLRKMNPKDPVSYDFALFGVGVNEQSIK